MDVVAQIRHKKWVSHASLARNSRGHVGSAGGSSGGLPHLLSTWPVSLPQTGCWDKHPSISFWIIHPREDIFMSEQEKKTPRSFRNVVLIWLDAFRHWQTEVTFVWFWLNWAEETLFSCRRNPIRCVIQERAFCRHDVYETGEKKKKKKGMLVSGETVTTEENTSCIKCNAAAKFHVALYFKDLVASIRIILAITAALYCSSSSSVHFRSIFVVLILKCVVIDCTMSGV